MWGTNRTQLCLLQSHETSGGHPEEGGGGRGSSLENVMLDVAFQDGESWSCRGEEEGKT